MHNQEYLNYFNTEKVLFATNGDPLKTPSIVQSKETYIDIAKNIYTVKSDIWALKCFLEILNYAISKKFNYVIYIDADCFITNFANLKSIFSKFQNGNFIFAGMPDGGCVPTRMHNKFLINPFFSMFNIKLCNENFNNYSIDKIKILDKLDFINQKNLEITLSKCPNAFESKFQIDNFENYYKLFSLLAINQKIMYLIAGQINNNTNPTTAIYNDSVDEQNIVCLHSWYARKTDSENLKRIKKIYEFSKILKTKYEY